MKELKVFQMYMEMFNGVIKIALDPEYISITNSVPAFRQAINSLQDNVEDLQGGLDSYCSTITGIAQQKKQVRIDLASFSCTTMSSVFSYAKTIGNEDLAAQMKTTLSKLKRASTTNLLATVNNSIEAITPLVPSLADYNITISTINDWTTLRDQFNKLAVAPHLAITSRKGLGENLDEKIKNTLAFVRNQLDTLAQNFRQSQPLFYNIYKSSRKLNHTGIRHTGLQATITNELGQPIFGATITIDEITENGKTYKAVSGITGLQGFTHVSQFNSGIRTVTIKGPGIVTETFGPFRFKRGSILSKSFIVQPALTNLVQIRQPAQPASVQ